MVKVRVVMVRKGLGLVLAYSWPGLGSARLDFRQDVDEKLAEIFG